jgi:chorismate mutase
VGFFRKQQKSDGEEAARTVGLVIEAPAPPEGGPGLGPGTHAHVRVQADLGTGRKVHETRIRLSEEHWLVLGMDVEVTFDPGRPDRFEIDWDRVPSMAARAVANDPALADPVAARRKVAHAVGLTRADTGSARTERVERALQRAGEQTGPAGKLRAVVLIATIRGRRRIVGDDPQGGGPTHDQITYQRPSAAVLAVNVPQRAPYAVYAPKFKCEVDLLEPLWMPLPALVSAADPRDVEILWDEVPSHEAQLADRISASHATQQARASQADEMRGQIDAGLAPQMRQLAPDNAKRALHYVQDPKMRKMLIDQYRAAGIDVRED